MHVADVSSLNVNRYLRLAYIKRLRLKYTSGAFSFLIKFFLDLRQRSAIDSSILHDLLTADFYWLLLMIGRVFRWSFKDKSFQALVSWSQRFSFFLLKDFDRGANYPTLRHGIAEPYS